MNIFKLVNVMEKKMTPLSIEPNLCTRIISPKGSCNSCIDYCPTNSITIMKNKIEINDQCVECGLCTTVCPTSAISLQRPSLNQLVTDIIQKYAKNERVYLHCKRMPISNSEISSVTVPCLGMIPREVWVSISRMCENLAVYHPVECCRHCEVSQGEDVWRKELGAGEAMSGKRFLITAEIQKSKQQPQYDHNRRSFFTTLFSEIKSTNKLAIQEALGGSEVQSYREKLQDDPMSKVKKEWSAVSTSIVEKVTNESAFPYMNKRKLILEEIMKSDSLQKRNDYRLPTILPDCNFCGACTTLCPTNALSKEEKDRCTTITLQPHKCVDCHLCEDICFFQNILLQGVPNNQLLSKKIALAEKPN
ncbi:4Fe-4S binding protein [Neobacillus drentensis]|uniref:4Fe-4S binding protein n=1 Tax=Neobacillus drentensis TaxID=220684 RepID=UPI00285E9162|nr:4Fe-4S binding protein [Neobacillus drentensis]MDR7236933.1 ferredoxin [Neobacillus drentensis]